MKIKTSVFLPFLLLLSSIKLSAQLEADTLINLPGATIYGSQTVSLGGTEKSLYINSDPVLVDGSVSDVFKQIPALVTDIEGGVTYRGSVRSSMVWNGIPYGLLEEYNGDFLIQLPARFFRSVSVSSFPPIEWMADGDAGVVNIVPAVFSSGESPLMLNIGASLKERYNAGVIVNRHPGKFHITAKYNYRKELRERTFRKITTNNAGTTEMNNNASARPDIHLADLHIGYDLSPADKIAVYGLYYYMDYDRYGRINNKKSAPDGTVQNHIYRHRNNIQQQKAAAVEARWQHQFSNPQELLEVIFNYNNFGYDEENRYQNEVVANGNIAAEDDLFINHTKNSYYLSAVYRKAFINDWIWKSGYTARFKKEEYTAKGHSKQGEEWTLNPVNSNNYSFNRETHLLFTSLRKGIGDFYIEPGVQLEYQHQKVDGINGEQFRIYPRLQVEYIPSADHIFAFHYLQRAYRPVGSWLNDFTDRSDATHITEGNPSLKDEQIHLLELSYTYSNSGLHIVPALYYRNRSNRIMEVAYQKNEQTVWKRENLGRSQSMGAEIATYWRPVNLFAWQFSGNVYRDEIDARIAGYDEKKSLVCGDLKNSFHFYLTRNLELQLDGFWISDQLTPQGKVKKHATVNAGATHYFMDRRLRANLSIQNIFDSMEEITIIDSADLQMRQERNRDPRMVWLSLAFDL